MGVNGIDPLGLRVTAEDVLLAHAKIYGDNDPLLQAYFLSGHTFEVGNILFDFDFDFNIYNGWWDCNHLNMQVEQDLMLSEALSMFRQGLVQALGKSGSMQDIFLDSIDDAYAQEEARRKIAKLAIKVNAPDIALLASLNYSVIGIFNEGADFIDTTQELLEGNYTAAIGYLPVIPGAAGKIFRKVDLDGAKIKILRTEAGRKVIRYADNTIRFTNKIYYQIESHHIFFKCLGGTDEAANRLDLEMLLHHGSGVGLHQDLLNHMGVKNYKPLKTNWRNAGINGTEGVFLGNLRDGYAKYFKGSQDFDAIMEIVDEGLKLQK